MNKLYKIKFDCRYAMVNFHSPIFISEETETKALIKFLNLGIKHPINNIKIKFICDMDKIL